MKAATSLIFRGISRFLLPVVALCFLSQCEVLETAISAKRKKAENPLVDSKHVAFRSKANYPKTYDIYRNSELYEAASYSNTKLVIDLSDQRMLLYVGAKVAIDTPCCTGKAGKRTPTGTFPIREKIRNKRSTIFGSLYKRGKKVYGGDRRKYKGSYDKYVGAPLPYWMRLTGDGIGIHASQFVKRHPASAGCIRTPEAAVKLIYAKVGRGTKVQVKP